MALLSSILTTELRIHSFGVMEKSMIPMAKAKGGYNMFMLTLGENEDNLCFTLVRKEGVGCHP